MEEETPRKKPLPLDWDLLLDQNDVEPPPLTIIKDAPPPPSKPSVMSASDHLLNEEYAAMSDSKLEESIERQRNNVARLSHALPDKGEKLRATVKALEEERYRRKHRRAVMDVDDEYENPTQISSSDKSGALDGSRQERTSSQDRAQSEFAMIFSRNMEHNTDCKVVDAFDEEVSILSHFKSQKTRPNGDTPQRQRLRCQSTSRQWPFLHPRSFSINGDRRVLSNGDLEGKASSACPLHQKEETAPSIFYEKKGANQVSPSNNSRLRKGQTIVFLDEDETDEIEETMEPANKLTECMKDAKIYYPSRDDPEAVEICYTDINCLGPEGFLTSPIMNFYIRFLRLRASQTNRAVSDYHFFNTFFYKKLKQAVSYKGNDKESFFIKFRRWWRGVNIFQKAYIFIPIHEDLHWSLVIICFPDKEDESGPIILHLDSLGFHFSKSVFENIRSYLRAEWNYMNQEVSPSDLPIADRIWKHLPRRIDERTIAVPQQKNDYDCGLFVLFFMERFIEEAPERLKKKDLAMFGKQWFRPEEASSLRVIIRELLVDAFQNASEDTCVSESSPVTSSGSPP